MSGEIEITRDFLMDAGGWKEMKTARGIHRKGIVSEAKYEDGMLSGVVRDGAGGEGGELGRGWGARVGSDDATARRLPYTIYCGVSRPTTHARA